MILLKQTNGKTACCKSYKTRLVPWVIKDANQQPKMFEKRKRISLALKGQRGGQGADHYYAMNRFQACLWHEKRQLFKPSFTFFNIRRKRMTYLLSRAHNCSYHPTDAQKGPKKIKSLKEISTKPQSEFVQE